MAAPDTGTSGRLSDLEILADLYAQADSYVPALETLEALLARPESRELSAAHRATLALKQATILRRQGKFGEGYDRIKPLVEGGDEAFARVLRIALALEGSPLLCQLGRYDDALELARRAHSLAELESDRALAARSLGQIGFVQLRRGDMLLARESYEEALTLFRRLGDESSVAWVRSNLGVVCKNLCEWDVARTHFLEAIAIHRRLGEYALLAKRLQNLGVLLVKSGAWERAHTVLAEAKDCFTRVGNRWGLAVNALAEGWLARLEGRLDASESLLSEALDKSLSEGFQREEALAREFLGDVAFERGDFERASESYRAALVLGERLAPAGDVVSEVLRRIAETDVLRGRLDAAKTALDRAQHVCRLLDDRYENAVLQRVRGRLALASGQTGEGEQALRASINLLGEMGERFERGKSLVLLAHAVTDPTESRKLLYRASACFAEVGAERELAAVERDLAARAPSTSRATVSPARESAPSPSNGPRLRGRKIDAPILVGPSRAMSRVLDLVARAASTDLSVILVGETGTGKELVARAIHAQSERADRPFLAVNCGALRAELALSQLFGHRRGAFTGAHADGVGFVEAAHTGTLLLDEIGELPADVQVTLLRFLESGEYLRLGETHARRADVRILGATHVDLRRAVAERRFRADLFYRLHEIEIHLPALRERPEDILPVARYFLSAYGGDGAPALDVSATGLLTSYTWPGNVRELENCMKRALALLPHGGEPITGAVLEPLLSGVPGDFDPPAREFSVQDQESERRSILSALDESQGNKSRAADRLGISRKTLYARMRRLGLPVE
ncbi:MAG: sigma 54-interacting transcriptional regulator [Candidatus Eiseniibacteriota bacterium]